MRHVVKLDDFDDYVHTAELAGAYGGDENKSIMMHVRVIPEVSVIFKVEDHRKVVGEYDTFADAVNVYNEL